MTSRCLLVAVVTTAATAALVACATTEGVAFAPPSDVPHVVPTEDAAPDAAPDAADPVACADCEYFPSECTDDVLCPYPSLDPLSSESLLHPLADVMTIRGRGPSDVWLSGALGALAHFDGAAWKLSDLGAGETQRALWLRDSVEITFGSLTKFSVRGVDAAEGADAGVSADGWSARQFPTTPGSWALYAALVKTAWATSGSDVLWVGADGGTSCGLWRVRHTVPATLTIAESIPVATCKLQRVTEILGLHSASSDVLWAVGGHGAAIRIDGPNEAAPTYRILNSMTTNALRGVWAASDTDVWAVGTVGTIRRYRGDEHLWEAVDDVPTNEALNAVWGTSASDIWAVGDAGVVLHYDGARWSRVKVAGLGGARPDLYSVWSSAPGHVWIGGQGVVLSLGGKP